tara:strand:- start:909 stop:1145 length:237 start_codon:yes stop_codon:yes gene_type:complete
MEEVKILLMMIICSAVSGTCDQPYQNKNLFNDWDSCMRQGYIDSLQILDVMGAEFVNDKGIYIKFACKEIQSENEISA